MVKPNGKPKQVAARNRADLARFARDIRGIVAYEKSLLAAGQKFPPSLDHHFARRLAIAIKRYLSGKGESIEHALGVVARGPDPDQEAEQKKIELVVKIVRSGSTGRSLNEILDEFSERGETVPDIRTVQRWVSKYEGRALATILSERLSRHDLS
jgi:hypothetical protein